MAENKTKDVRSEGSIDEKPCFSTSDNKILMNLHKAALQKAADKARQSYQIENMQDVLVNTMLSEDGKTISTTDGQYEIGFVTQYLEFKKPSEEEVKNNEGDFIKAFLEINKEGLEDFRNKSFEILSEYLKYFADSEPKMEKMVDFIPDYDGESVKVSKGKILSMKEAKRVDYLSKHSDKDKPRLGFKFGFTFTSSEESDSSDVSGGEEMAKAQNNGGK